MPRRVFITGASGFIGRALAERYRAAGTEVRGMDVAAFLAAGPGGARLPRKKGGNDRMADERRKRAAGQNGRDSVEWKSEAEMALRQQYDS